MITGIIESIGKIISVKTGNNFRTIGIETSLDLSGCKIGDSIAINGVCLTFTKLEGHCFLVDVVSETLQKTNLGSLTVNSPVNIEKMMLAGGRINGHFVQGHVDTTAKIQKIWLDNGAIWLSIDKPKMLKPYIMPKGSITIDGMSITVCDVLDDSFTVTLIPHTQAVTIAKFYTTGSVVNLEADMMAKHLNKLLETQYGHLFTKPTPSA